MDKLLSLRGVGKKIAAHLARINIHSLFDLLFHLPSYYQDRTQIKTIRSLEPEDHAVIEGEVVDILFPKHGRTTLLCTIQDKTGMLHLRFFHRHAYQSHIFVMGQHLRCYSEVRLGQHGLEMIHPEVQVIAPEKPLALAPYLTPIYPATEGLSQYILRKIMTEALNAMEKEDIFQELLPSSILQSMNLPTLKEALLFVHRPSRETDMSQLLTQKTLAQQRLIFEELLTHRVSLLHIKECFQKESAISLKSNGKYLKDFLSQLSFELTSAQKRVFAEIQSDVSQSHPMLRLVQGDVGSGKTVIAALAMLHAIENHYQAAMMAPTELLAEQHYRVFQKWLSPLGIHVVLLTGHIKGRQRELLLNDIASGDAHLIIGTHALFQETVCFSKLALIVIDEHHRFGVRERALLLEKGKKLQFYPHQLIMTATPIPRTLAMSFYADLDCSVIDELPKGRIKIETKIMPHTKRDEVIARVREVCEFGRQAYWVCPLIDESEKIACLAATQLFEQLQKQLPALPIALIHGRMLSSNKDAIMRDFQHNKVKVLVATTVIEVGVDVPDASIMIIENAERLGLSQLHQLRGRVGRGSIASHCILLYQPPLSDIAKERLHVMRETTDGFVIAEKDLHLRGPGDVFGTKQAGEIIFYVADLMRDSALLKPVQDISLVIMQHHRHIIEPLMKRWLNRSKESFNT